MGNDMPPPGAGTVDAGGAAACYTVVETARGYLYLVLVPSTGKLLYDVRTLAFTAEWAERALAMALGEQQFRQLAYISPECMLEQVVGIWAEHDIG